MPVRGDSSPLSSSSVVIVVSRLVQGRPNKSQIIESSFLTRVFGRSFLVLNSLVTDPTSQSRIIFVPMSTDQTVSKLLLVFNQLSKRLFPCRTLMVGVSCKAQIIESSFFSTYCMIRDSISAEKPPCSKLRFQFNKLEREPITSE
jgi:hypothetical protein